MSIKYSQREEISDNQLLEGLASHSEEALEHIYAMFYPVTLNLVLNNSGGEEDAKDIFQEAVIVLYEKCREEGFELSCKLRTYVYSICRHLWLKRLRQKGRQAELTAELEGSIEVDNDLEQQVWKDEQFSRVRVALEQLGEPCRTIIQDYYIHRSSMQDLVEKFGYTNADNAKNQKYKCLMRLKKIFFAHNSQF